ncbi:MAG: ASKHA domain-containing protein [Oscillospiraceae bacterium]|jgi:uncharacterized 2Fe-2S/4Fe-4S cluster protein (DUF4445 family)|nr:ASKHA domain-containing protein [Oscillospiraceae bacterium]
MTGYEITFRAEGGEDISIFAAHGENILDLARKANVAIDAPCSGNGSCGKCRVRLLEGEVYSAITRHINDYDYYNGWRLACVSKASGKAKLLVPDVASAYKSRLRVTDMSSPLEMSIFNELQDSLHGAGLKMHSGYYSAPLELEPPSLDNTMPDNERLVRAVRDVTGFSDVSIRYSLLRNLPDILRANDFKVRVMVMEDNRGGSLRILDVFPYDDSEPMCGLAIDIGTTTVSALLVDLETGRIIAKGSSGNGQIRYGADVINRIIEQQKPGGIERLRYAVIHESLLPIIHRLCDDSGVNTERIYRATVAANTTMNHLLLGVNANNIRIEPYIPAFFETEALFTRELGIDLSPGAKLSLAPNIGSYVGGDVTAGALASMMWSSPELTLLVDLGTNGELVFGNNEFLMACACSAGPAFEGGDIKCGMRATDGAIDGCVIDGETMEPGLAVIGGEAPVGLCGSGIIDVIAELFHTKIINGRGKFVREGPRIVYDEEYGGGRYIIASAEVSATGREIYIDETDIDNFIRTKGAIFSAIMTLTEPLGFSPEDISRVFVAGGIGSGINIKNAIRIGMFPELPEERFRYIGNSSLSGAYAILMSADASKKLSELAKSITYVELSTQSGYMDSFVAACFLPHTDSSLFPGLAGQS